MEINVLQEALALGFRGLKFSEALELDFKRFYAKQFSKQMRIALFVGLLIFAVFGIIDGFFSITNNSQTLLLYGLYYFALPVLIVMALFSKTKKFRPLQQWALVFVMLVIGVTLIALVNKTPDDSNDHYFMSLLLLEMLFFTVARMRFWFALLCAIFLFLFYNAFFMFDTYISAYQLIILNFFYVSGSILSLMACYYIEYYVRKDYLQYAILKKQSIQLSKILKKAKTVANIDGLTQIANRRVFDEVLAQEWSRCLRTGTSLGLLMIDIDFFKVYNDAHGHQAGDDCLIRVAQLLKNSARRTGDLAARYGGEEFVIVLPNTDVEHAMIVAKHIFLELAADAIPVTLSIGIAAVVPTVSTEPASLIQQADRALYEAKHQGRNRWVAK